MLKNLLSKKFLIKKKKEKKMFSYDEYIQVIN